MNSYTRKMNQLAKKIYEMTDADRKNDEKQAVMFVAIAYGFAFALVFVIVPLFSHLTAQ